MERIKAEQGKFYDKMKENIKIKYNNIITNPHSENIIQDIYLESIKFIEELLKDKYEIFKGLEMYDDSDDLKWSGFMRINNGEYFTEITVKEFYKILIYFVEILINEKIKMITESEGGEKEKVARIENYSLFIDIVDYILYIGFLGNRINSEDPLNKGMLNEVEIEDKMKNESYLTTQTKRDDFFSNMKKEKFHFVHLLRYLEIRSKKHEIENSYIGDSMKRQLHIRTIAKFIFERYVKKPKYS